MRLAITSPFAARPISNSVGRGVPPRRGGVGHAALPYGVVSGRAAQDMPERDLP